MEIQALRARVQPALHQDFDAVREEFVAETGTEDPRAFVHHLREWELIPFDLANTLLIELAVERAPDEDDDEEEAQDPTILMRWDDDASGEVDPEAATQHHDRAELLGWVDDPSDADGELPIESEDEDEPAEELEGDDIDPEADTVHLDRRAAILGEEGASRVTMVRTPAAAPARTPPPVVRDPSYVGTPPATEREVPRSEAVRSPTPAPASTAAKRTPAPAASRTPAPAAKGTPASASERPPAEVPTLVEAPPLPVEPQREVDLPRDPSGRFEFLDVLDEDGLARTVLALDTAIGRHVALRVMNNSVVVHAPLLQRFKTEARATSQLDHPGIPAVYDFRGPHSYFHRLMDGEPLATWLAEARAAFEARKPLPAHLTSDALLDRFVQVCDILAHAHARGLVHRDLRPDNVLVGPYGATWVVDWGIALVADETVPNAVALDEIPEDRRVLVGTAGYCSPEQANGRQKGLDGRSDVYALGLMLFEILALKPAVGATSVTGRLARQQQGLIDPLIHAYGRPISPAFRAIVARATTTDPSQRYPNASALADDVRRAIRGQPITARRDGLLTGTGRLFARHPAFVLAILGLLVLGWTLTLFLAVIVYST